MGHHDSDSAAAHGRSTTPMRRAGAVTVAASLALVTAAGAAAITPSTTTEASVAQDAAELDGPDTSDVTLLAARADYVASATSRSQARAAARAKAKAEPKVVGTRYAAAVSGVNVRKSPNLKADTVQPLDYREKVRITNLARGDWRAVMINGKVRWVKGDLLSKQRPKPLPKPEPKPVAATTTSSSSGSSASGSSSSRSTTGACTNGSNVSGGSYVIAVHRAVCATFPSITSYGTYRSGGGYHSQGRAIDIMVSGSLGWQVAEYVRANAGSLGVTEVIYSQKIWTTQRAGEGWRSMSDRGSTTANHYDHVHVSTL